MFYEILKFDLRLQLKNPLLWITVLLFCALAFFSTEAIILDGAIQQANINTTAMNLQVMANFTLLSMLFVTLFIAHPLLRDHEYGIAELFFSKPISKSDYVLGRFSAGFALILILCVLMLALMALGSQMPWIDAKKVGPLSLYPYVYTFLISALPNMLFIAGLLALLASVTRSMLMVYVGVVAIAGLMGGAQSLMRQLDNQTFAALLDPSGFQPVAAITRYWLVNDFNTRIPELSGVLLANRLLWGVLGLAMLGLAVRLFKPIRSGTGRAWLKRRSVTQAPVAATSAVAAARRRFTPTTGFGVAVRQFLHWSWFDTVGIFKSPAFAILVLLCAANYWVNLSANLKTFEEQAQYPVTSWMLMMLNRGPITLFLTIVVVFYAGELLSKERAARIHEVTSACPTPNLLPMLGKLFALAAAVLAFIATMVATGMLFQIAHGYWNFEGGLYASALLLGAMPFFTLILLALSAQVIAQNKFVGYALVALVLMGRMVAGALGVEDHLVLFGTAPVLNYSDMDGYGNNLVPYIVFQGYWFLLSALLLVAAAGMWVRGVPDALRQRVRRAAAKLRGPFIPAAAGLGLAFCAVGVWIFYNTHMLNDYRTSAERLDRQADYEKTYQATVDLAQPKITAVDVALDLSPSAKQVELKASYTVRNPHAQPISELHLLVGTRMQLALPAVSFAELKRHDERFGLYVLQLKTPLQPGASARWVFELKENAHGFDNNGGTSLVLDNGSFLHGFELLPSFGYNRSARIANPDERRNRGLPPLARMPLREDVAARSVAFNADWSVDVGDDADWIDFTTVVSTDPDQVALAPGYLQKEWQANGRRYFQYRMDGKMGHNAAWVSGRWEQRRGQWQGVPIEVYFDPKHAYNVDRMIEASKTALTYCSEAFAPYPHKQLRIIEFPRTHGMFAESFANTVPYSESLGFIADLRDPKGFDLVSYVIAHEVAHQWWGNMATGANVQGATLIVESLAQYSALMVMQKTYGKDKMRQILKLELDNYLRLRGIDLNGEQPLSHVENQKYVHYFKAALAFYRLQEEIGEDALNRALRNFAQVYAFKGAPYPSSAELLQFIRAEAAADKQQLITDLFERISFIDSRVVAASGKKLVDGRYEVTIEVSAAKRYADGQGGEADAPVDDWIEVGVFAKAADGAESGEKALVLERKHITSNTASFRYIVDEAPSAVGFDPYNKLIDPLSGDNRMTLKLE